MTPTLKPGDRVAVHCGDDTYTLTVPRSDQEPDMTTQTRHDELVALLSKISEESVTTSNVLADMLDLLRERLPGRAEVKVAPFDPDLIARNLDAIKHELETPPGKHGDCCEPTPNTPTSTEAGDPDEALARALYATDAAGEGYTWETATPVSREYYLDLARAAREHIAEEGPLAGDPDADSDERIRVYVEMVERAEKAEAERDEFNRYWKQALADVRKARDERDGWTAKHAALRAAVQVTLGHAEPDSWADLRLRRIIDRDDDRDPRPEARPEGCCGKCPPAFGGGYDCTCEGNPVCEGAQPDPTTVAIQRAGAINRVLNALRWGGRS